MNIIEQIISDEIQAWHGSPHNFKKFTTNKMGTGEGVQAFGWGLYFTDEKEIDKFYGQKAQELGIVVNGKLKTFDRLNAEHPQEIFKRFFSNFTEYALDYVKMDLYESIQIKTKVVEDDKRMHDIINNELSAVINQMRDAGLPPNSSSTELQRFESGRLETQESYRLNQQLNTVRNNRDYNEITSRLKEISDNQIQLGTKRKTLLNAIETLKSSMYKNTNFSFDSYRDYSLEDVQSLYDFIMSNDLKLKVSTGKIYNVTLHKGKTPDQYDWLLWYEPVSEIQKSKLLKAGFKLNKYDFSSGEKFYHKLTNDLGSDKNASLALLKAGIDGVKYPAGSLSSYTQIESSNYNYVVFDENAVTLNKKMKP